MKLINLKISAEEKAEYASPTVLSSAQEYPYGLQISLCEESIAKLFKKLPEVGDILNFTCSAQVKAVSQCESTDDGLERNLTLQITDMGINAPEAEDKAKKLYGKS